MNIVKLYYFDGAKRLSGRLRSSTEGPYQLLHWMETWMLFIFVPNSRIMS